MSTLTNQQAKVIPHSVRRNDFPVLRNRPKLVYLDSAATTQKPQVVIDAITSFYEHDYASVHRGVYDLAAAATERYELARGQIAAFIGAESAREIVFTANATAALNLAAHLVSDRLNAGDEIILTVAEHHSNLLPWQRLAELTGARLVWLEPEVNGSFPLDALTQQLSSRTKVVAVAHVSNVLGYVAPLRTITEAAHQVGAQVIVDGAQSGGHMPIDLSQIDADYAAFSGHKTYGPSGTGWLYAKQEHLERAEPQLVGGGAIKQVTRGDTTWHDVPWRFEAGTQNMAGVVGLAAAIAWLQKNDLAKIWEHEQQLTRYALDKLSALDGLELYGPPAGEERAGIISFSLSVSGQRVHSHDIAQIANRHRVAVRGGHHCAQVLLTTLGLSDIARASVGCYSTIADIDQLVMALDEIRSLFKPG